MVSIHTNLSSLIAQGSLTKSTNTLNRAIEQMSTGYKINHASDNAANYSIKTNMDTKISAYMVAEDNAMMGLDMLQTAESSLNQISDKLSRLRALAVTAQNGTYGAQSLSALNSEAEGLVAEIKRCYANTEYSGKKIYIQQASVSSINQIAFSASSFESLERVSEAGSLVAGKSYRIDDSVDLIALQDFVNGGGNTANITFELTDDIIMDGIDFKGIGKNSSVYFAGIFRGNGHVIKNLNINSNDITEEATGLFGAAIGATIDSVGVEGCSIDGGSVSGYIGALVGFAQDSCINNCYSTGDVSGGIGISGPTLGQGGLVGYLLNSELTNCYSSANVNCEDYGGGLVGVIEYSNVSNSYSTGNVNSGMIGGFAGLVDNSNLTNNYSIGTVTSPYDKGGFIYSSYDLTGSGNYYNQNACSIGVCNGSDIGIEGKSIDEIQNVTSLCAMGFTESNGWLIKNGTPKLAWEFLDSSSANDSSANVISLYIGINSKNSSTISFDNTFDISGIDEIVLNGIDDVNCLASIDRMIKQTSDKSIEFGAVSNRLESVLEEINVQYENLVSSRSTIQDADMSEVSATYIQQQILQQASATLMATANQTPAIALQLI